MYLLEGIRIQETGVRSSSPQEATNKSLVTGSLNIPQASVRPWMSTVILHVTSIYLFFFFSHSWQGTSIFTVPFAGLLTLLLAIASSVSFLGLVVCLLARPRLVVVERTAIASKSQVRPRRALLERIPQIVNNTTGACSCEQCTHTLAETY